MAFLLQTTAFLAVLGSTQFLNAQDPATPAEAPVAALAAPAENTEGQTIYSVPSLKQIWEAQAVLNGIVEGVYAVDEEKLRIRG